MKKLVLLLLPLMFLAQACNFLFGDLTGDQGSGSRGIFLSTDGGQTWGEANKISKDKNMSGAQVARIVFDRGNARSLLAVTYNSGVYATNTGGDQWFQLLPSFAGYDAFVNPNKTQEVFAAGARNNLAVILKTSDAGGTWTQIYSEPKGQAAVTALVYDPRTPAVFYAGLSTGTILKSIDAGNSWNTLIDFQDRIVKMTVAPDGKTILMLGRSQGLRKSQDAGKSWSQINPSNFSGQYNDFLLVSDTSAVMYLATDKGLYKSQDGGSAWVKLSLPATPSVNDVSAVAVNQQNHRQIFATISSTVYRSDDFGATWRTEALSTRRVISQIAIDPNEPNRIYVGLK